MAFSSNFAPLDPLACYYLSDFSHKKCSIGKAIQQRILLFKKSQIPLRMQEKLTNNSLEIKTQRG